MRISRKKYILILAVSAAVFAVLCAAAVFFSRGAGGSRIGAGEHPLRISEVMASNTICPNGDGVFCDWIEIQNLSDRDFNVSGYRLSDDLTEAKYSFPVGTVIPAGGYIVVSCSTGHSGSYAPFAISRRGGETLVLMNGANLILDRVDTVQSMKNTSLVRQEDGTLALSHTPTPGYSNDDAGYAQYLAAMGTGSAEIRLSEIMAANTLLPSPDGVFCDWIEVENVSDRAVSLAGYRISDREGESRYAFPDDLTLAPGEFAVVRCSTQTVGADVAPFGLSADGGETVVLIHPDDTVVDRVKTVPVHDNEAYIRTERGWETTWLATPGFPNDESGYAAYVESLGYGNVQVVISEIMTKNETGITDEDGVCVDWIELYNGGGESVSLEGWYLSDKTEEPNRWRFPAASIAPGEYLVVYASGKNRGGKYLHTNFSLSTGETVILSTPVGTTVCAVECPLLEADHAWALRGDGTYGETAMPTPGGANG